MSEQPTIFDESFDEGVKVRRRTLMPLFLKIYLVVLSCYAAYQVLGRSYVMYKLIRFYAEQESFGVSYMRLGLMLARSLMETIVLITMILSVWTEWKWAIRFNWVVLVYWSLMAVVDYVTGNGAGVWLGIAALLLAPYYSILYQMQRRWEQDALSGRELRKVASGIK